MARAMNTSARVSFETPASIFSESPKPFDDPHWRRCFRLLRMVAVLHGKGFHGLRVFPYEYPLAYRIELFPATYADETGVRYRPELEKLSSRERELIARHSGANGKKYFGWKDAGGMNVHQLAILFLERFPALAKASYHLDFPYAGWYATLLAHCEYGFMPYLFAEYEEMMGVMRMRKLGEHEMYRFPLPPSPAAENTLNPLPRPGWLDE